jgi:hypothetical protein
MVEGNDFRERVGRIEALLSQIEKTSDPATRATVHGLMESVMDFHGTALNRVLELVSKSAGNGLIDGLAEDPLVASLLILHGLHPLDREARVALAMNRLGPAFAKHGAEASLEHLEPGTVRIAIQGVRKPSALRTLKNAIEEQFFALAPDVTLEGLDALDTSDFVAIETLAGKSGSMSVSGKAGD